MTLVERTQMNALVLHAVGDARLERIPRPDPGPDEVRVRIGFCGVCGSDIPRAFVKGTYKFPTVCGHEFAGVVDEVGEDVESYRAGDRVAVFPLLWCGKCPACEQGKYVQCLDYDYLGSRSDGGFAEYVVAPARNLLRVPDNVTLEEAAMTEPAAVALHAVRRGGCAIGQTVAIFGAGPIGLMAAQWARAVGASRVILFDILPRKLEMAKQLGFEETFNSRENDPVAVLNDLTRGEGAHVCIESAGVPATFLQAVAGARRGGRMVILGNPSADVTLPATLISQVMRREIDVVGTWNSEYSTSGNEDDWNLVLRAVGAKTISLLPLITHRVPLERAFDALRMMKDGKEFYSKVLIQPEC
jgi:L-iditol 2-dehydrogenase